MFKRTVFLLLLVFIPSISRGEVIDVTIKGVDDGVRTNRQQDYNEAVMNAKLQAIERAGVEIESITRIVNFQLRFQSVESKAKAILLPGFHVVDIGYTADGSYQVVLVGKIQLGDKAEKPRALVYLPHDVKLDGLKGSEFPGSVRLAWGYMLFLDPKTYVVSGRGAEEKILLKPDETRVLGGASESREDLVRRVGPKIVGGGYGALFFSKAPFALERFEIGVRNCRIVVEGERGSSQFAVYVPPGRHTIEYRHQERGRTELDSAEVDVKAHTGYLYELGYDFGSRRQRVKFGRATDVFLTERWCVVD